jgi:Cd2+/Zn2+-exporting ATPase
LGPLGDLLSVNEYETVPGRGLVGIIDDTQYFLGNHRFAEEKNVCNTQIEAILKQLEQQGKTTLILGDQLEVLAIFAVADTLRESSYWAIQALHKLGIKIAMITGDNPTTAQAIGQKLSIDDIQSNLLPEEKLTAIGVLLRKYNKVGMVLTMLQHLRKQVSDLLWVILERMWRWKRRMSSLWMIILVSYLFLCISVAMHGTN